jgi:beta-glucuronidase
MKSRHAKRLRGAVLVAGWIMLWLPGASAATKVDLDGYWRFKADPSSQGEFAGWARQMPSETEMVSVPGTWSTLRKYYDYLGEGWYFKPFTFPATFSNQRVELHLGATFYKSRVWLNGTELGGHEGGYTAYFFDITPYLKPSNFLAVEIDNRPGVNTIPAWALKYAHGPETWYDWWPQGGIVRDVWLKLSAPQLLRWQQISSAVSGDGATVTDHVHLENHSSSASSVQLTFKVWAPDGDLAAESTRSLELAPGPGVETVKLPLKAPQLWSFDNPNLYRMEARLTGAQGNSLDSLADNFGVRTIEIRNRQLFLNGQAVRLTGIDRHEDSPWEGLAETAGTIRHDYDDLKNLQVTLTRPVHYPQNPRVYDFCDRHGILLIPEIPVWQFNATQFADPRVIELAKQMMREVIEQDGNHPSIFAWSVSNESASNTPEGVAYFKTMYEFIKSLDPDRLVTYADDSLPEVTDPRTNAASFADFVMWNEYYGSGHGSESLLPELIEKIGKDYPDKMVIISESSPWMPLTDDPKQAEEFRNASIGKALELFGKYPWIAGVLYWCYQPFRSHARPERTRLTVPVPAPERIYSNFDFVDQDRQRHPIYSAFQKYNSPAAIRIELEWPHGEPPSSPPSGFTATIERRRPDQIPSYPLNHYQAVWQAVDEGGAELGAGELTLPDIGPPHTLEISWKPLAKTRKLTLHLWLYRPTGFLAGEETCRWEPGIWYRGLWRCGGD